MQGLSAAKVSLFPTALLEATPVELTPVDPKPGCRIRKWTGTAPHIVPESQHSLPCASRLVAVDFVIVFPDPLGHLDWGLEKFTGAVRPFLPAGRLALTVG